MTQNNAGAALSMLGKRESSSNRLGNVYPEYDIIDLAQSDLAVTVTNWLSRQVKLANVL
jgi:hypothetical protein